MLKKSAPTSKEFIEISEISKCFKLMGILIGRAILDEKIFDFPLSRIFWDLVLHRVQIFHYSSDFYFSQGVSIDSLFFIDKELTITLREFIEIALEKTKIDNDKSLNSTEKQARLLKLKYKVTEIRYEFFICTKQGCKIEDLAITFIYPGHPEIELIEKGSKIQLSLNNLSQYIDLLTKFILHDTIQLQVNAFRSGLELVLNIQKFMLILIANSYQFF